MKEKSKTKRHFGAALCAGIINGLLGTGGGVPLYFSLARRGADKSAYATASVGVLLLSLQTVLLYRDGGVDFRTVSPFFPILAVAGGALGALLLGRVNTRLLRGLFGGLLLFSGVYLLGKELFLALL